MDRSLPEFSAAEFVSLAGVNTALAGRAETTRLFLDAVSQRRAGNRFKPILASSMNGQTIYEAINNHNFRSVFQKFDFNSMDGQPAVIISRFWKLKFVERVATTDLIHDVVSAGVKSGVKHYVFGASQEVLDEAVKRLKEQHAGVQIVGSHHGYITDDELEAVALQIRAAQAEIVWICMGVPREQALAIRLADLVPEVALIKTGGGVLDFVSGRRARAPDWLQTVGLEWLFRLYLEPKRLFKRYLVSNPVSLFYLISLIPGQFFYRNR